MRRRDMLLASAALPALGQTGSAGTAKSIVLSSANGLAACKRAHEIIEAGGDTLEAVVSGVTIVEDDPEVRELLVHHMGEMAADPAVHCIVLAGQSRTFAAGSDIKELVSLGPIEKID